MKEKCGELSGRSECKNDATEELHSCPFRSDVHEDDSECCSCCNDCKHECAMDI